MHLFKHTYHKPDGRAWIQYSRFPFAENLSFDHPGLTRGDGWQLPELRYHAMRGEWVAVSASRNSRPFLPPPEYCPLCPMVEGDGEREVFLTEVPKHPEPYTWAVFENMYPALAGETGRCEVILYTSEHGKHLDDMDLDKVLGLIQVWQDRSKEVGAIAGIEQVFIFENRGKEIGVTLPHAHGQLYAFTSVPPFLQREHQVALAYHADQDRCLICKLVEDELKERSRLVLETETIVAYIPYAARYPYELHVSTKAHRSRVEELSGQECQELARVLKGIVRLYDRLFDKPMPYMMVHHQCPAKGDQQKAIEAAYHWHMEFYPTLRKADKMKYQAGVESGTGMFINDTIPEEKAAELRRLADKVL